MTGAPAAEATIRLLNALASHAEPQAATSLARELGLARSTTYRILATLEEFGYVAHMQDSGRYALGAGVFELATAYQRQEPLRRIALPIVLHLADRTRKTVHMGLLHGRDVIYVLEERGKETSALVTEVGVRLPAELTATGRAMLAMLGESQVAAMYPSESHLVDRTGRGPKTLMELKQILAATRRRGWAQEIDSVTLGWSTAAVAVLDGNGYPVAAIACTYSTENTSADELQRLVNALRQASAAISNRLDGRRGRSTRL